MFVMIVTLFSRKKLYLLKPSKTTRFQDNCTLSKQCIVDRSVGIERKILLLAGFIMLFKHKQTNKSIKKTVIVFYYLIYALFVYLNLFTEVAT